MSALSARGLAFELCRITIELDSPLALGAGQGSDPTGATFVVDANGLPAIPGTSLAGVLRHLVAAGGSPEEKRLSEHVFGYQKRDDGASSSVEVSWAQIHDKNDVPVAMRAGNVGDDEVLGFLAAGTSRDHVRLDGHGVVDGDGKFEIVSVPAGARFTFELIVHKHCPLSAAHLVGLLRSPAVRLGGSTRRGLGTFHLVRVNSRVFDLARAEDRAVFRQVPRALHAPVSDGLLTHLTAPVVEAAGFAVGKMVLTPQDLWLVGGGDPDAVDVRNDRGSPVDIAPLQERRIRWADGRAHIGEPELLLPSSGIKGALRHRTAFHVRRMTEVWAPESCPQANTVPPEVEALFGSIKDTGGGQPGRLLLGDAWPTGEPNAIAHVSIDRFSGGPMDGCLYTEAPILGDAIEVPVAVDLRGTPDRLALKALRAALNDLFKGRLPLGGGANRGHGYFHGRWEGKDPLEGVS